MSLDCNQSYHGSNSSPSFAKTAIIVTTFYADGLHRTVPRSYESKSDVLLLKNLPCQVNLTVWDLFLTDRTKNMNILPLLNTESNHVFGLW
jgi:hypothetical protein